MAAKKEKIPFPVYKGYPLVRCKDDIYYGDPRDPFVIFISILETDGSDERVPTRVTV